MQRILFLLAAAGVTAAGQGERVVASVVPSLAYGPACSSTITLQNLADRAVMVDVEAHRESGALVALDAQPGMTLRLEPHQKKSVKLRIEEETSGAWVKLREKVPSPALSQAVAITGATECVAGNQLRNAARDLAYPMRNPWFDADTAEIRSGVIALINTAERPARASGCYSSGTLVSIPGDARRGSELTPVCSASFAVQVPPFGSRLIPVAREESSHFSLKTEGDAIVLQMLRPIDSSVRIYAVDSTIRFGEEVPEHPAKR